MPKVRGFHDWEAIKTDYCSGELTVAELAQKWRVSVPALKSRASRGQWPTPTRFRQTVQKALQIAEDAAMQGLRGSEDPGSPEELAMKGLNPFQMLGQMGPRPENVVARQFDALSYQQAMAQFACQKVAAGFGRMKPPANWRELQVADTIARRALGLDSKGGSGAASMVRVTTGDGTIVDVATASFDGEGDEEGGEDWPDGE